MKTAKPGHLKNREWLDLKPRSKEKIRDSSLKREREIKFKKMSSPVLDWGKSK